MHQIRIHRIPRWGAYSAPPYLLAGFKGPTSKGRGRKGRGGKERGWDRKGTGGEGERRGGERKGGKGIKVPKVTPSKNPRSATVIVW